MFDEGKKSNNICEVCGTERKTFFTSDCNNVHCLCVSKKCSRFMISLLYMTKSVGGEEEGAAANKSK